MVKRIHYPKNDKGDVICGAKVPPAYHKTTNYTHNKLRNHRISEDPNQVTCQRCLEQLSLKSNVFACPACNEITETLHITELVTIDSTVMASIRKGGRHNKHIRERVVMDITCPICGKTTQMGGIWQEIAVQLKINGYFIERAKVANSLNKVNAEECITHL